MKTGTAAPVRGERAERAESGARGVRSSPLFVSARRRKCSGAAPAGRAEQPRGAVGRSGAGGIGGSMGEPWSRLGWDPVGSSSLALVKAESFWGSLERGVRSEDSNPRTAGYSTVLPGLSRVFALPCAFAAGSRVKEVFATCWEPPLLLGPCLRGQNQD